jgi:hypothetical protein
VQVPNIYLAIAIGVSIAAGGVIVVRTQRRLRAEGKKLLVPAGEISAP